jgi:CO/xanthine dehydrogenase Mo-binding subunit
MLRRSFLQGAAGLVVAFSIPRFAEAAPGMLETDSVDAYLAIAPDGGVTVYAGKVDLGTGARAAIRQIVAEELGVRPEKIAMVEGDTALTPNQGGTGGSTGIMVGGLQIRQAAATARQGLINLAAAQLKQPAEALVTADGAVVPRAGRSRDRIRGPGQGRQARSQGRQERQAQESRRIHHCGQIPAASGPARETHRPP